MQIEKKRYFNAVVVLFMLSFYFQAFYVEVGFSLKAFYVFTVVMFIFYLRGRVIWYLYGYEIAFLVFMFLFSMTAFYSFDQVASLRFVFGIILMAITYAITKSIFYSIGINKLVKCLLYAGLIFNILSLSLYILGLAKCGISGSPYSVITVCHGVVYDRGIPRLIGTVKDPNFYVLYCSLFFFLGLTFLRFKQFRYLLVLSVFTILLTLSRGGFIAILGGVVCFIVNTKEKKFKRLAQFILLTGAISMTVWYFVPDVVYFVDKRMATIGEGSGRFKIWADGWYLFQQNPMFGLGIYSFLEYNVVKLGGTHYMHNTFLEVLVEGGVFVFFLYMISWFMMFFKLIKTIRRTRDKQMHALGVCFLSTILTVGISLVAISALINEYLVILFTLSGSYILSVDNMIGRSNRTLSPAFR